MGFLKRAIREGIRRGVGDAIGKAVRDAVEPTATELTNKAAAAIDNRAQEARAAVETQVNQNTGGLEQALSSLQRSMESYATEAAKNLKVCPSCGEMCPADTKFCHKCGAKLPETTVAEGAVCPNCGKQNPIGTKFCSDCGTKLPSAVQEEEAKAARDAAIMAEWEEKLAQYPKWSCGGTDFNIEVLDGGYLMFAVTFPGDPNAAYTAVKQYQNVLMQNGFRQAGQYPSIQHLYKKVDGVCCHVDTEHCFGGDPDCATLGFDHSEPTGGFDYVKPEPKPKASLRDLLGL